MRPSDRAMVGKENSHWCLFCNVHAQRLRLPEQRQHHRLHVGRHQPGGVTEIYAGLPLAAFGREDLQTQLGIFPFHDKCLAFAPHMMENFDRGRRGCRVAVRSRIGVYPGLSAHRLLAGRNLVDRKCRVPGGRVAAFPPADHSKNTPVTQARGRSNRNVLPTPGVLSTPTWPPIASTRCLTMERPSPVPPSSRERPASAR